MRRVVSGNGLGRLGVWGLSTEMEGAGRRIGRGAGGRARFSEGLRSPEPQAGPTLASHPPSPLDGTVCCDLGAGRSCCWPHPTDEETEAQGDCASCPTTPRC